ncbi:electron transport complex subunit RsxC [Myxococcota bacterium]|nr:electron transport complex subunit RsxC [Myxococcota bacterium]MBU1413128.1 electron transport complex subunit RsxC [Myxococcota bacterium]MBU1512355.1 electron transport complex subunit RsxC [Myxococcota bacterium]PKN24050.1 MAG: electron transport complex subunit RsxC [Deltaproteobacteria bacterium HGW-Deltaproteobacteria-22]
MTTHANPFPGGIHPGYHKDLTSGCEAVSMPVPKILVIPLSQHLGAPAKVLVKKGDLVKAGQMIAEPGGFISAAVHASSSGKVTAIGPVELPNGSMGEAVTIETDGAHEWEKMEPIQNPFAADPKVLVERVKAAGIVGMGGATFPTHVKLTPPADSPVDWVMLNGAECEPYLTADHRVMLERADRIAIGVKLIRHIMGVSKVSIGIEGNKADAIEVLKKAAGDLAEVVELPVKYPQGSEKQLIFAITGRRVPPKKLPSAVGVTVFNVATVAAIADAVIDGMPLVERVVTVTGSGVNKPGNFRVPVGTRVMDLMEFAGGYGDDAEQMILGGPMMGRAAASDNVPIIKGIGGVLVLTAADMKNTDFGVCIRCGRCLRACPNAQNPMLLGQLIEKGLFSRIDEEKLREIVLDDCFECGSCTFVCPNRRPLVQFFQMAKGYYRSQQKRKG